MQRYIRIIRVSFHSFCWSDNYLLFSRQDVEHIFLQREIEDCEGE